MVLARAARAGRRGRTRGSSSRARPRSTRVERGRRRAAPGRGSCGRRRRSRSARAGAEGGARASSSVAEPRGEVARVDAAADLLPRPREHAPARRRPRAGRRRPRELVHRRQVAQLHPRNDTPRAPARMYPAVVTRALLVGGRRRSARSPGRRRRAGPPFRGEAKPGRSRPRRRRRRAGPIRSRGSGQPRPTRWLARGVDVATGAADVHVRRGDLVRLDLRPTVDAAMAAGSPLSLDETEGSRPSGGGPTRVRSRRSRAGPRAAVGRAWSSRRESVVHPARLGLRLDRAPLIAAVERGATTVACRGSRSAGDPDPAARSAAATRDRRLARRLRSTTTARTAARSRRRSSRARSRPHPHASLRRRRSTPSARAPRSPPTRAVDRPRDTTRSSSSRRSRLASSPSRPAAISIRARSPRPSSAAGARRPRRADRAGGARSRSSRPPRAKALGIRQKLVSFTTEMGESSSNRIHNVHLMADFIDGTDRQARRGVLVQRRRRPAHRRARASSRAR